MFGSLANSADWSILKEYEGLIDQLIGVDVKISMWYMYRELCVNFIMQAVYFVTIIFFQDFIL